MKKRFIVLISDFWPWWPCKKKLKRKLKKGVFY